MAMHTTEITNDDITGTVEMHDEAPADSRSPWVAAGHAGVAIGRRSKDAGVATGAAFTRFARQIAGSF